MGNFLQAVAIATGSKQLELATLSLVETLAHRFNCDVVSIGLAKKPEKKHYSIDIQSISGSSHFSNRQAKIKALECLMEEAIDMDRCLVFPVGHELEKYNNQMNKLVVRLIETEKEITEKNLDLERLANHDVLTNCLNRRALSEQFEVYYQDHSEQGKELACLMFDIDLFKRVNDTFGHTVGDHAIQFMAKVLHSKSRAGDLVARYGGEEFVVVLPNTTTKEANEFADRVRKIVQTDSSVSITEAGPITVSIGVSTLKNHPKNREQLIDCSDQALYIAKNNGRNQVVCWEHQSPKQ